MVITYKTIDDDSNKRTRLKMDRETTALYFPA